MVLHREQVHLEIHIVKPWRIDRDVHHIVIRILIVRRDIALHVSVAVLVLLLIPVFLHL